MGITTAPLYGGCHLFSVPPNYEFSGHYFLAVRVNVFVEVFYNVSYCGN